MKISDVLRNKPLHADADVVTIRPHASVRDLLGLLAEHGIGAVVVTDADRMVGIASERDVVRALHRGGTDRLDAPVSDLMSEVIATTLDADLDTVAATMTERRIRHLPVVADGALVGLVSIGDVVSSRLRELETHRSQLEQYIAG